MQSEAHARMHLRDFVREADVDMAIQVRVVIAVVVVVVVVVVIVVFLPAVVAWCLSVSRGRVVAQAVYGLLPRRFLSTASFPLLHRRVLDV